MNRFIALFLGLCLALAATAQADSVTTKKKKERTITLAGEIYDSFTKAKVKALMTLLRPDSTFVDSMTCWTWGTNSYYEFKVPAKNADYIIKASADGYRDTTMAYQLRHIARNSYFELPRMLIKKKQRGEDDVYKEVDLNGVVITGTKVKLAYRGDTLVYNASAFNLPEGSMLDGLIRQMPGAELKDNGDIYINGRKVDYLTLNGKDFFKGQNKVMLDNLPYYTVNELKVYDKTTKQSELIGHDVEKKDYVMDVQLKREYNRGYMANVEVGGGTDKRYMGRLFGLYYDDHSRVSVFGNANNVNENRRPGSEGDWRPSDMPQGLRTTKQTGLHIETEDQDKNWEESMDANFDWSDADNWSRTSRETFATDGNILGGAESWNKQNDFRFSANNYFQVKKPVTLWSSISASYYHGHRSNTRIDSTYRDAIINRTQNDGLNRYTSLGLNGSIGLYHKFAWGDYLTFYLNGSYGRSKPSESWSIGRTYYAQRDSTELRHNYTDTHSNNYNYSVQGDYTLQLLNRWFVSANVSYSQDMSSNNNNLHRLDWLYNHSAAAQGGIATNSTPQLDWLPSTQEALATTLDPNNSDWQRSFNRQYNATLSLSHSSDNDYFSLRLPISNPHERLYYTDLYMDTLARRSYVNFEPSISWSRWGAKKGINDLGYRMNISRPDLSSLMPADDTANPLVTRYNNPGLKATITHSANIGLRFSNDSTRRFLNIWSNASLTQRSVGTRTIYNTTTGAYTYMQDNINGNWYWGLGSSYEQPLDSAKRLTLSQRADIEYTHSVDFPVEYISGTGIDAMVGGLEALMYSPPAKSTVHNWTLHERLGLEYQRDKLTVGVSGEVNWRRATSRRENFENINAFEFNYGGQLRYTIPWVKVTLGTDIRMFSRRGYQSAMMNTDDLVWNGELARSLFKEKLTFRLTAFDLLHQLSNKQYSVNAQGRTETWTNCIPRYVMLTVAYKFSATPAK